jgi:hypothetical protein
LLTKVNYYGLFFTFTRTNVLKFWTIQDMNLLLKKYYRAFSWFLVLICYTITFSAHASDTIPASAQRVYTGVYLMNLYDLNMNEHSFYADFYIWFKWKGDIDPTQIEFVNVIEKWAITQSAFQDTVKVLSDGYNYTGMRVEGRFYHPFALARFPLDEHALSIQIEHAQQPYDSIVYLPDSQAFTLHNRFEMPGWDLLGTAASPLHHTYSSNFGDIDEGAGNYGACLFTLTIARPKNYFLLKLLLPLIVVLLAGIGAMFIFPTYVDARISLPIGALLTAVFLQQSYNDALPDVGYMVLMDKIYVLGYLLITIVMLKVIISGNKVKLQKKAIDLPRIYKTDVIFALLLLSVFMAATAFMALYN